MSNIMKRESHFRSPLASILNDADNWMVGFDDVFDRLVERWDNGFNGFRNFPAAKIHQLSKERFQIDLNVDGFKASELKIEVDGEDLIVTGSKHQHGKDQERIDRDFYRSFLLDEHDRVVGATLDKGLLEIIVERPQVAAKKPLGIPIRPR